MGCAVKRLIPLLLLGSCAWDQPIPAQPVGINSRPDPAAQVVMQCDAMRLQSFEAHRLCVLRGIDRLAIYPQSAGISHVPLLADPYPPLAPGGSANPYHYHFYRAP